MKREGVRGRSQHPTTCYLQYENAFGVSRGELLKIRECLEHCTPPPSVSGLLTMREGVRSLPQLATYDKK